MPLGFILRIICFDPLMLGGRVHLGSVKFIKINNAFNWSVKCIASLSKKQF